MSEKSLLVTVSNDSIDFWNLKLAQKSSKEQPASKPALDHLTSVSLPADVGEFVWSKAEQSFFVCLLDGRVVAIKYPALDYALVPLDVHMGGISAICYSEKHRLLLLGTQSGFVAAWSCREKKILWQTKPLSLAQVKFVKLNCDDSILAYHVDGESQVRLFQIQSRQQYFFKADKNIRCLNFSTFKPFTVVCAFDNGLVSLLDISAYASNNHALLKSFENTHVASVEEIQFSPFNRYLMVSVSLDKRYVLYDVEKQKVVRVNSADVPLTGLTINANGVVLAMSTFDGSILVYDLGNGGKVPIVKQAAPSDGNISKLLFVQNSVLPTKEVLKPIPVAAVSRSNFPAAGEMTVNYMDVFSPISAKTRPVELFKIPEPKPKGVAATPAPSTPLALSEKVEVVTKQQQQQDPLLDVFSPPKEHSAENKPLNSALPSPCDGKSAPLAMVQEPILEHKTPVQSDRRPPIFSATSTKQLTPMEERTPASITEPSFLNSKLSATSSDFPSVVQANSILETDSKLSNSLASLKDSLLEKLPTALAAQESLPTQTAQEYSQHVLSNIIEDCLANFQAGIRADVQNLHLDLLRQFDIQRQLMQDMFRQSTRELQETIVGVLQENAHPFMLERAENYGCVQKRQ